jgi:hypothetical protein
MPRTVPRGTPWSADAPDRSPWNILAVCCSESLQRGRSQNRARTPRTENGWQLARTLIHSPVTGVHIIPRRRQIPDTKTWTPVLKTSPPVHTPGPKRRRERPSTLTPNNVPRGTPAPDAPQDCSQHVAPSLFLTGRLPVLNSDRVGRRRVSAAAVRERPNLAPLPLAQRSPGGSSVSGASVKERPHRLDGEDRFDDRPATGQLVTH